MGFRVWGEDEENQHQHKDCFLGRRDDMSREDAIKLVAKAIRSGIFNDLGSGSNVDICVIEANDKASNFTPTPSPPPSPPPPARTSPRFVWVDQTVFLDSLCRR